MDNVDQNTTKSRFRSAGSGRGKIISNERNNKRSVKLPTKGRGLSKLRNQPLARTKPEFSTKPVETGIMPNLANLLGCDEKDIPNSLNMNETISSKEAESLNYQDRKLLESRGARMERGLPSVEVDMLIYELYSDEELKRLSVVEVTDATELYGRNRVNDPRMGTLKNDKVCGTCERDIAKCTGHLGHISLAMPIINPLFRKQLAKVLTCVCNSCGGLLATAESIKKEHIDTLSGDKRLSELANFCFGKPCLREHNQEQLKGTKACVPNPEYIITAINETGILEYKQANTRGVLPLIGNGKEMGALEILNEISKEDLELMGYMGNNHPNRYIMKSLVVIPPCARPPSFRDGYEHPENLTSMYQDILRVNNNLKAETKESEREILLRTLTFKIQHLIDNTDKKYTQGTGRVYNGIKQRVQGKEALIRGNMVGKRVNFSARTVITPAPFLKFGQVAIPVQMASILTVPETVGPFNIDKLTFLLKNGQVNYILPGRGQFRGSRLKVNEKMKDRKLEWGDEVERWLQNGDYVIINRQPSLSSDSFKSAEVVLWNNATIGLHLSYTTGFNADFDGDEMNIHVGQSLAVQAESAALTNVRNCISSTQNNRNVIGVVYDALTGSYLMTYRNDVVIDANDYYDILSMLTSIDGEEGYTTLEDLVKRLGKYGISQMSGRGLFSALFPPDFSYKKGNVIIQSGVLVSGAITKDHVGPSNGSIIQAILNDYGVLRATNFLTDIYFMMNRWLESVGFSIGLDACTLPMQDDKITEETQEKLQEILPATAFTGTKRHPEIEKEIQRAYLLVQNFGTKFENPLEEQRREQQIQGQLNRSKGLGVNISSKYLPENNALNIMSEAKTKGSAYNTTLITGMVGQTYVRGDRINQTISEGKRTLPFFKNDDMTPSARGFIENSFYTGLTAPENFFHLTGTRENLLDTAIKTSDTGNIHHRMGKMLEDIRVYEDGSVRDSKGFIYQFAYGDNGFTPAKLERVNTNLGTFPSFIDLKRTTQRINNKHGYSLKTPKQLLPYEQELIYNGKKAYIVDVGVERIKIMYKLPTEGPLFETIYRKDIDMKTLKSTGILKPRKYFNQPITTILKIGQKITINSQPAIVFGYTPTSMQFTFKNDKTIHTIKLENIDFDTAATQNIISDIDD